jgi:signal transduction histidine kinase/DNA-binding NarL/FixJ family response regulator
MSPVATTDRVRILLIEDNPADADLIREYIDQDDASENFEVSHVVRLDEALAQLRAREFDIILTDFNLPDAEGMPLLDELRREVPDTPIVVITGQSQDLGLALDALRHGAQDYLIKGASTHSIHRSLRYAMERKQMQDALTRSQNQLRSQNALMQAILDNMADGVVVSDRDGKFVVFNQAAHRIYGLGVTDAAPLQWSERYGIFHAATSAPVAPDRLPLVRAMHGEASDNVELLVRRPELAKDVYFHATGRPLFDSNGKVDGGMVVLHDITQHKEAEEKLRQKNEELTSAYFELDATQREQLELKDQVLSHVSHELRTPLTAAFQFVTILKRGLAGELQTEQMEYVDDIERNLKQLRKMIADLLETTRTESGKLTIEVQRLELQETVVDIVRTLRTSIEEKGIALDAEVPHTLPAVAADPARVRQVLTNLVDNAQKFTPAGGSISIRAGVFDDRFVCVSVADTGRGIEPSQHQRIFSRLGQVNDNTAESRKGLGLGLFICREIVRRHGGDISVESTLGAGSTFYFTLPKYQEPSPKEGTHGQ